MKLRRSLWGGRGVVWLTVASIPFILVAAACSSTYRSMPADEKRSFLAELETTTD